MLKAVDRKAQSRERILSAASRAIRRLGFDGVGVADIMSEAGLTHGGFYAHFESKDELLAAAVLRASRDVTEYVESVIGDYERAGKSRFRGLIETYLSDDLISDCENGCAVAALCAAMPGQPAQIADSSRTAVTALHRFVRSALPEPQQADTAWAVTGAMIGALQLARVMGDNAAGRAVLAASRRDLLERYDVCEPLVEAAPCANEFST